MVYRLIPDTANPQFVVNVRDRPGTTTQVISVDNVNAIQSDFRGIAADNMLFTEFPDLALTPAQKLAEYDRIYTSGVRMVRTWFAPWWADASWPNGTRDWTSAKMGYFYTACQAMKDRGVKVILTIGWHFMVDLCGITTGGVLPVCVPTVANETNYAAWVSEAFHQLINVRGFDNVVAGMLFTEPNNNFATPGTTDATIPAGYTAGEYYAHLATIVRAKIAADDASRTPILPRIQLIGTEEQSTINDSWLEYVKPLAGTQLDAYAAHAYDGNPDFPPLSLTASGYLSFAARVALITNWVGDASTKQLWVDEYNFLVGFDADSTGYRQTADAGFQMGRGLVAHMKAGVQSAFIWTLKDEHFEDAGGYTQLYGIAKWIGTSNAVKPSWYCVSLLANLCGGGSGTKVYNVSGETSKLHVLGVFIPSGDRWSASAAGDWTVIVVNEGAATNVSLNLSSSISGRTMYRYTYSSEIPPKAATDPAYLLSWDQRYTGITTKVPGNIVAGRSVTVYSTINLGSHTAENLALAAGVSADSTIYGNPWNVVSGNFSNVIDPANTWRKASDGAQAVTLSWTAAQTFSRVELAFAANTAGVVWANWDTSSPTALADYTVQYLNASGVWTTLTAVTGNASPNRTHTFTSVTSTGLRLLVTSVAASANLNQIGVYAT